MHYEQKFRQITSERVDDIFSHVEGKVEGLNHRFSAKSSVTRLIYTASRLDEFVASLSLPPGLYDQGSRQAENFCVGLIKGVLRNPPPVYGADP